MRKDKTHVYAIQLYNFIQLTELSRIKLIICQVVQKPRSSANDVIVFVIKMHQETLPLEMIITENNNNNQ